MPILNYTTEVKPEQTIGVIQGILSRAGARSIMIDYDEGIPVSLTFVIEVRSQWFNFRLPANVDGVLRELTKDPKVPPRFKNRAQAHRVAWRIIKNWIESQMALIEAGQAELAEVFLPYLIHPQTGRTLFQEFHSGNFLPSGEEKE